MSSNRFTNTKDASNERKNKILNQKAQKVTEQNHQSETNANPGTLRVFRNNFKEQVAAQIAIHDHNLSRTFHQKSKLKSNQMEKDVRYTAVNDGPDKKKNKLKKKGDIII